MKPTSLAWIALVGCGRINFDPLGGVTGDGMTADGDTSRPNVVFMTSGETTGGFGGLAGGDAFCQSAARSAGLPGTFLAWLSTSTVNAPSRFAGSRGWVRTDGVPVLDTIADFQTGKQFNPVDRDETAARAIAGGAVWTGTKADFTAGLTCGDWTASAELIGTIGIYHEAVPGFTERLTNPGSFCSNASPLYCFEVGHAVEVVPRVAAGRVAFLSNPVTSADNGIMMYDALCNAEALAAGLGGTFRAAMSTTTTTIASRFTLSLPWQRVDGTPLGNAAFEMFDGINDLSFVNQHADGSYVTTNNTSFRCGAIDAMTVGSTMGSTCFDWTSSTGQNMIYGDAGTTSAFGLWYGGSTGQCGQAWSVLCLQE